jgi:ABC-type transporter Mla subunit MlaD
MPAMEGGNDNGRVTIAVIGSQLSDLIQQNGKLIERFDKHLEQASARDKQLAVQAQQITQICTTLKDHGDEIDDLDKRLDDVNTKTNWWSGANTTLSILVGAVAAIFGK